MRRKTKILVAVVVGALLLTSLGVVGVVGADEPVENGEGQAPETTEVTTPREALISKVAEVLGVTEEEVLNALQQGQRAAVDQAVSNWLDRLVENGKLSQEEADEIEQWLGERPEALDRLGVGWLGRGMGMGRGGDMMGSGHGMGIGARGHMMGQGHGM